VAEKDGPVRQLVSLDTLASLVIRTILNAFLALEAAEDQAPVQARPPLPLVLLAQLRPSFLAIFGFVLLYVFSLLSLQCQTLTTSQEDPNFHHYLQSSTPGTASLAVFGDYTTAAQFQLNSGQVEQQLAGGSVLYLTVLPAANSSATYLATTFTTTPNAWGTWSFQGDGLNWSASNVTRSNTGAFLACGGGSAPSVNVNLGA
jgi:hypothetical protein